MMHSRYGVSVTTCVRRGAVHRTDVLGTERDVHARVHERASAAPPLLAAAFSLASRLAMRQPS